MTAMTAAKQRIDRDQKAWKYIHDANSASVRDLSRIAIEDGARKFTYGLMFRAWEQYASVFSALEMTGENRSRVGVLGSTCAEVTFAFYGLNMVGAEVSVIPLFEKVSAALCSTTAEVDAVSTDSAIAGIVRVSTSMSASRRDKSFRVIMNLLSIR